MISKSYRQQLGMFAVSSSSSSLTNYRNFPYYLLSVKTVEKLLEICNKNKDVHPSDTYILRNYLVSLCMFPWNIDINKGSSGVCYHGNMGEIPSSMSTLLELMLRNHEFLLHPFQCIEFKHYF